MTITALSRREREVLDLIYQHGRMSAAEVLAALDDPPSYSTVRSILSCLEEKDQVQHEEVGRAYVYRPVVSAKAAREGALEHVLKTFFHDSVENLVNSLISLRGPALTPHDRKRIAARIARARKEGR